jgi:hypothetical protein
VVNAFGDGDPCQPCLLKSCAGPPAHIPVGPIVIPIAVPSSASRSDAAASTWVRCPSALIALGFPAQVVTRLELFVAAVLPALFLAVLLFGVHLQSPVPAAPGRAPQAPVIGPPRARRPAVGRPLGVRDLPKVVTVGLTGRVRAPSLAS